MKTRVIFCLFLSLYLIYTHKSSFMYKLEEFPYVYSTIGPIFNILINLYSSVTFYGINQNFQENEQEFKIGKFLILINLDHPHYKQKVLDAGFQFEEHKILTEDGYILTAWRIPGRLNETQKEISLRKPTMLQHGLFDTSYTWLMLNTTDCLSIQLAEKGYDVWMTNSRGNIFSMDHTNPEYDSNIFYSKFWDFTFHEMAEYDVTANIFYIKNFTKFDKINYIGHSQGTVQYFIQYTLNPTFLEENVDKFVGIGTVVNVFNTVILTFYLFRQAKLYTF